MHPQFDAEAEQFRLEVRDFLRSVLPPDWSGSGTLEGAQFVAFSEQLRERMHGAGYVGLAWPEEYGGGGRPLSHQVVLTEELTSAGLPHGIYSDVFSVQMFGSTLLAWGTEQQKRHFLPRVLDGSDRWCQGYSEPQAGSDLAGIRTRAVLDGDQWRIDGQKIWTSGAHEANWIFALVRTDPDAGRYDGLTLLACPLDQPGVDVRPIRQLTGEAHFSEVFFTDAVTPAAHTIGPVGAGWRVAMALLEFERGGAAAVLAGRFEEELARLGQLARERRRDRDPDVRRRLGWCHARVTAMRLLGYRGLTQSLTGAPLGPETAMTKLYWSEYHRRATELAMDLLGDEVLVPEGRTPTIVDGPDAPGAPQDSATWVGTYLNARASTIYAGSSEVQRNVLAERVLGLPREPRVPARSGQS